MKATEFIEELTALINKHGDLECEDSYGEPLGHPEYSDDVEDGFPVFVLCDKA